MDSQSPRSSPNRSRPTDFLELVERGRRGRLKVYVGSAPGVGKTSRLIEEARALSARGVDLVLAHVGTRGSAEAEAALAGLEAVAPRRFEHLGLVVEEMDVAAVLARSPQVAIVDDLAHANVHGSRNARRHEDVADLLEAGISVIAAMDVLHLESLRDLVERLTGLVIHDTVPDTFLRGADQVVTIDVSVEDLLERFQAGKIAPAGRADASQERVYQRETLAALRELALREVAETLDYHGGLSVAARKDPQVSGRVMVCLSSLSPRALTLLRRGSRFMGRLATDWFVVYVETPGEAPQRIDESARRRLLANVEKARELGAEVIWLHARDPVPALIDFARSHGIGTIMMGRSQRPWWRRLMRPSIPNRLMRAAKGLDLYVIAERDDAPEARAARSSAEAGR
jgi:two-component system sensor histidine kinase KdpD